MSHKDIDTIIKEAHAARQAALGKLLGNAIFKLCTFASVAAGSCVKFLQNAITSNDRNELEEFLSTSTDLVDLEHKQRQWDFTRSRHNFAF